MAEVPRTVRHQSSYREPSSWGTYPLLRPPILASMVICMKTTVEIPDALLEDAKALAGRERTTIRALIVEGLRRILQERRKPRPFSLRKVTFKGRGLQPQVADGTWETIRDMSYEGRGS